MDARNAGRTVVAISCDQSLNSDASPMPRTLRLSQRGGCFSVAGVFTNPLNNKETKQQRKTGSSTISEALHLT
jgi:hypothetical protein